MREQRALKEKAFPLQQSFYLVLLGDTISKIGDYIYKLGIPIYVLSITNSATWTGVTFAIQQVGVIVSGIVCGPVIDRHNPKKCAQLAAGIQFLLISFIPILHYQNVQNLIPIITIGFLLEIFSFAYRASINSLTPILVKKDRLPLATSYLTISKFIGKTLGPIIAGALIALISPINSLWIDSLSFLFLVIIFQFIKSSKDAEELRTSNKEERKKGINYFDEALSGFNYVVKSPELFSMSILNFFLNLGYVPLLSMFVVHLTETLLYPSDLVGTIYSIDGVAALAAGVLIPFLMKKMKTKNIILICALVLGAAIYGIGNFSGVFAVAALFMISMISSQVFNKAMYTYWQMRVERNYLARVFSISTMLESLSVPSASLISGIIVTRYSSFLLFRISGALVIVVSILYWLITMVLKITYEE